MSRMIFFFLVIANDYVKRCRQVLLGSQVRKWGEIRNIYN
jgi:hypothetical protein